MLLLTSSTLSLALLSFDCDLWKSEFLIVFFVCTKPLMNLVNAFACHTKWKTHFACSCCSCAAFSASTLPQCSDCSCRHLHADFPLPPAASAWTLAVAYQLAQSSRACQQKRVYSKEKKPNIFIRCCFFCSSCRWRCRSSYSSVACLALYIVI